MAVIEGTEVNSQNSFQGRGALSRYDCWTHGRCSGFFFPSHELTGQCQPAFCLSAFRIVSMVMTLREWAQKSLAEEMERPDSFLERFRGPANMDIQAPPSRFSHIGSDTENEMRRSCHA